MEPIGVEPLVQPPGLEPGLEPWKGSVLPLDYGCVMPSLSFDLNTSRSFGSKTLFSPTKRVLYQLSYEGFCLIYVNRTRDLGISMNEMSHSFQNKSSTVPRSTN